MRCFAGAAFSLSDIIVVVLGVFLLLKMWHWSEGSLFAPKWMNFWKISERPLKFSKDSSVLVRTAFPKRGVRDANGEGRDLVSKDLRRDLDAVQSEFGFGYDGGYWQTVMVCQLKVIGRPLQSAN